MALESRAGIFRKEAVAHLTEAATDLGETIPSVIPMKWHVMATIALAAAILIGFATTIRVDESVTGMTFLALSNNTVQVAENLGSVEATPVIVDGGTVLVGESFQIGVKAGKKINFVADRNGRWEILAHPGGEKGLVFIPSMVGVKVGSDEANLIAPHARSTGAAA